MGNFNRGDRSGGGRSFERRGFNDRGSRGPAQMFQATCGNCGKSCEVPFKPTNGRPVFCSSCFEADKGSSFQGPRGRDFDGKQSFRSNDSREMFDVVCDECGNNCKVPFQPRGDKPIYCSNCFGEKKGDGNRGNEQSQSSFTPQYKEQFEALSSKLDRILSILAPDVIKKVEEVSVKLPEEPAISPKEETKVVKKRSSKKASKV